MAEMIGALCYAECGCLTGPSVKEAFREVVAHLPALASIVGT